MAEPAYVGSYLAQGTSDAGNGGEIDLRDSWFLPDPSAGAGHIAVTIIGAVSCTLALPTGWTELAAGSVGRLTYAIGYRRLTGTDDWTASATAPAYNPATWSTSYNGYSDAITFIWEDNGATPDVSVTEATSSAVSVSAPSGVGPWNAFASVRSVYNSGQTSPFSWPTNMDLMPDIICLGRGALDEDTSEPPIVAPGTVGHAYTVNSIAIGGVWV